MRIVFACALIGGAGACNGPGPPPGGPPPAVAAEARSLPIAPPAPRTRDGEADAFGRTASDEDPAVVRESVVPACPAGSSWDARASACIIRDVRCPPGSTKVGGACLGEVVCPDGTSWDGAACRGAPGPTATLASGTCTLQINSIPQSTVFLDGHRVGLTPRIAVPAAAGAHQVSFVADDAKKTVGLVCRAGEVKNVAVKLRD